MFNLEEGVARLTLNRPAQLSAFKLELRAEVANAFDRIERASGASVLLLTDAEKAFCAGQNLKDLIVPRAGEAPNVADLRSFLEERRVARFKFPEQVELWEDLPRNAAGKVLKTKIRDALLAKQREGAS
jgi:enoyl-CoA hydratase/carnithine racemase